jgi:aspartate kinase, monofunctional class
MLIVQKFGGSSVADADKIRRVAGIIADAKKGGNDVVVVLSAQGDTTDDLIAKAGEITAHPGKRELDMLMTTGEQISIALCAMALQDMGIPAISLLGWQVGMKTNSDYGNARIKTLDPTRIRRELEDGRVVLVAGFQGINKHDDMTTLGRGGSDTTAVAIAAKMHADLCQIYTDVEGVYTADPRLVPEAKKLSEITYDEMLELASMGAQVLHNRSVELAKRYGVPLEVLSSYVRKPGTIVKEVTKGMEETKISGIAKDDKIARIALVGLRDEPGIAYKVFRVLAREKINVDLILQSIGRNDTKDISFTLSKTELEHAREALAAEQDSIGFDHMNVNDRICKLSVVGAGMINRPGVAVLLFEALAAAQVNIHMISTSEIKISVLIDAENADVAMRAVHKKFFEE